MSNVATLIKKCDTKKIRKNQRSEPPKYNCSNRVSCLLKRGVNLNV